MPVSTGQRGKEKYLHRGTKHNQCIPSQLLMLEQFSTLGSRVRTFRESAGLTQDPLASAAGIGRITLVRLEKGNHSPKLGTLKALASVLDRPVEDLLAGPDETT